MVSLLVLGPPCSASYKSQEKKLAERIMVFKTVIFKTKVSPSILGVDNEDYKCSNIQSSPLLASVSWLASGAFSSESPA